ncbi:MAG TPA: mechanosensitive ion channel domain-containing protein [Methylomirabilota bacterium]|jgi:small-conductance mechanosensitive channel
MKGIVWPALALLLALASPAGISPALARGPGIPLPASEAPKRDPAAIPVPEVARQAEEATRLLRELDAVLTPAPVGEAAEKRLPDIAAATVTLAEETRLATEAEATAATLDRLTIQWQTTRAELVGYVNGLARQATATEDALQRLARLRDTWSRTRADAQASRAPEPVIARIDGVLSTIATSEKRLQRHRAALLVLQDRVAREVALCDTMLGRVAEARQGPVAGLFHRDGVALWRADQMARVMAELPALLRSATTADLAEVRQFARDQRGRIVLHGAIFLGLLALIQAVRRRAHRPTSSGTEASQARLVVDRPISAALVLALLLSAWIYVPPIPRVTAAVITILILVPALRIVRLTLPPPLVRYVYGLGVFFLADLLRNLASTVPVLEQLVFVLEMLLAVALLATWVVRWHRAPPVPDVRTVRFLNTAGTLALAAFSLALVVAVAGYMGLALLLGAGVLGSAYLAVVLYAAVQVADRLIAFALHERPLSALAMVRHNQPVLERRARRLLRVAAGVAWVYFALKYFHLSADAVAAVQAALRATLTRGSISISLADVLVFVITVGAAFVVSRVIRFVLAEEVYPRLRLGRGLPDVLSGVLHYTLLLTGFLLALAALGVDLTKVTILAGAFGVGIGFGLQNIVNNLVSGSIILVERKINVGDAVQIGEVSGRVQQMGMRACTVRTWEGAEVIVPNASLTSGNVVNWTLSDTQRRIDLTVGVAYGTPPEKVIDILLGVAGAHPRVLPVPAPTALFRGFGESALQFQLLVWTDRFDSAFQTQSELSVALYAALREAGIEIPFPQREVRVRKDDPEAI